MDQSPSLIRNPSINPKSFHTKSFKLNPIEETVLEKILLAANDHSDLSPQRIADQMPYPSETISAAIDRLLTLGLVQATLSDRPE